jgi:nucleoside-diphosphate-sugar epimerase
MIVAVAGAHGFVGRHIVRRARAEVRPVVAVTSCRVSCIGRTNHREAVSRWVAAHEHEYRRLVQTLNGVEVVINAAGVAAPGSSSLRDLTSGNVLWPLVLALASAEAGTRRLVHVSSAAVQGRRDPLDESLEHATFSLYSESKAQGESALLEAWNDGACPRELVLYRPTSVHGRGRDATASLVRLSRVRYLPLSGSGDQPLPVTLVENVAAAALLLATTSDPPLVALHPWEGMTAARLLETVAPDVPRTHVPEVAVGAALAVIRRLGRASSRLTALSRKLDLVYVGQRVEASALVDRGYVPAIGLEGWRDLATTGEVHRS